MKVKRSLGSSSIMHIALIFSIFNSIFGILLLYGLDNAIHVELYNWGLQFSYDWAVPTWTLERLLGVCLILSTVLVAGALVLDIRKARNGEIIVRRVESKQQQQQPQHTQQPRQQPSQPPPVPLSNEGVKAQALTENSMVISCPRCKKMFGKPLVMLDFSDKKTQLVNVCPYCNATLGRASDEVDKEDISVGILDKDEKAEESRQ